MAPRVVGRESDTPRTGLPTSLRSFSGDADAHINRRGARGWRAGAVSLPAWIALFAFVGPAAAAAPTEPLRDAAAVLSLTAEQAGSRLKVEVTGIVTAAEPDWNGQFFVEDTSGGVFVENLGRTAPQPGDVITIRGVSHPGAFAPIISNPEWQKGGTAPLPEAKKVSIDDLNTGSEDGRRIEISGVVRRAVIENGRLAMDLSVIGHRLQVRAPLSPMNNPDTLIGAVVRVRGTAASHYIGALRHLASVAVYVPRSEDLVVTEPERVAPFAEPVVSINSVAQYRPLRRAEQRVHVMGTVLLQRTGDGLFLHDASGAIRILPASPVRYAPGDSLDAAGFLEYENHLPVLRDATVRRRPIAATAVRPLVAPFAAVWRGEHHADLVRVQGRVLDRSTRPEQGGGRTTGVVTAWVVQNEIATFTVEYASLTEDTRLAEIPAGSVLECDGVGVSTVDETGKPTSLRILAPSAANIRVIARPSWLTPARLLAGVAILGAGLVIVLAWLLTVSRKNATLRRVVGALETAQRALQDAHDTLEEKVAERSAQLQVEMTARKTAEVQFRAVLAERTRLARDLHDTLEQNLAGIALRLNTAAKLSRRDQEASDTHLQFARSWLHQSQVDLRRSIWDLRSRELEQFDLPSALRCSVDQVVQGTGMKLHFETKGTPQPLPEVVEENVLRVAQEALTNIAKHAQATAIAIVLEYRPHVLRVQIDDNGVGFDASQPAKEGHFGVIGMHERMKRLGGTLTVRSAPGAGTCIVVEVPLREEPAPTTAAGAMARSPT